VSRDIAIDLVKKIVGRRRTIESLEALNRAAMAELDRLRERRKEIEQTTATVNANAAGTAKPTDANRHDIRVLPGEGD
jgi:chromosome segregation ATPase